MAATQPYAPLRIDSLGKRFGDVTALDGVSLEVQVRACFGLLGPNGAGKSTLIRGIAGRVKPDAGEIRVFGAAATSAEARAALGWAPQELALLSLAHLPREPGGLRPLSRAAQQGAARGHRLVPRAIRLLPQRNVLHTQ